MSGGGDLFGLKFIELRYLTSFKTKRYDAEVFGSGLKRPLRNVVPLIETAQLEVQFGNLSDQTDVNGFPRFVIGYQVGIGRAVGMSKFSPHVNLPGDVTQQGK